MWGLLCGWVLLAVAFWIASRFVHPAHPLAKSREVTLAECARQTVIAHNDPSHVREFVRVAFVDRCLAQTIFGDSDLQTDLPGSAVTLVNPTQGHSWFSGRALLSLFALRSRLPRLAC